MHRIDTSTAQVDKFGMGKNGFTRGNPQTGTLATTFDADYCDTIQEELAGIVEAAGIILNKEENNQVLTALQMLMLPVGVPIPWPTNAPPVGWIVCDGASFTAEQFPMLAQAYPELQLPDLRGEFIRGWDGGRNIDPSRSLLSWQKGTLVGGKDDIITDSSNIANIDISFLANENIGGIDYGSDFNFGDYPSSQSWYVGLSGVANRFTAAMGSGFFSITRPRNIAFNYIVRAA